MAQTWRHLWPHLISWDNLCLAYRKCRRRKRYKRGAVEFDADWESQLLQLQRELEEGSYQPGPYRHFYIHEPKPRKISAAPFRDRVVHHAIVNILEPIYERRFIPDSYACRKGKGTHQAIDRAHKYLHQHSFYLKTDIVKFFPNIDHEILLELVGASIRDPQVFDLVKRIVVSGRGVLTDEASHFFFPGDDLFALARPCGLPIGNLTSQFLANVFLDPVDHFIKEELHVPGYVRYSDDLVLFGPTKEFLHHCRQELAGRLAELRLTLHSRKTHIRSHDHPLGFLGLKLTRHTRRLSQTALSRFNRRLRRQRWLKRRGEITPAEITVSIRCWLAHAEQANSVGIRRDLWNKVWF